MTLTKDISAKFAVAFVAVAMIFSAFAPAAQAQTTEDLQQMINDLLAQVAGLQSQLGGGDSMGGDDMSSSSVCPYTWTRDLNMGSEGADVMKLQQFLNSNVDTRVSVSGAGSAGNETMYYGPATGAAVSKFQVMHRADVLTPAGLVNPTTYFGPSTRAKANMMCASAPVDNGGDDMGGDDNGDDNDDNGSMTLSGEASLESFEVDDASDDEIEEGESDAVVAEIMVEFEDGDAEISRLDVKIAAGGASNEDAFETISLWVDGDMVAEQDADDEDEYRDDEQTMRFSGLDIIAQEDEELEILVAVSTQNNLDADEKTTYTVSIESMRFFDADGVADTVSGAPVTDDSATFDLEEAGAEDELKVSSSSDDPDATTLLLDEDTSETYVVFAFELDTDDSTNDIEITDLVIDATTTGVTTGSTDFEEIVDGDNVALLVGGNEVDADDVTISGDTITFEFDGGEFMIDAGEEITVEVEVEFDALDDLNQGATVELSVDSSNIQAEGADDLTGGQLSGSAGSEAHTLITEGIVILAEGVETSTDTSGDNDDTGEFVIEFEVTAYEEDFYIATSGAMFTLEAPGVSTSSFTLTSTGDEDTSDVFTVEEGETETFTLTVTVDAGTSGQHRVTLDSVDFSTNTDGVTGAETRVLTPATDFRTDFENVNA